METLKDRFSIICQKAKGDPRGCDGTDRSGACTVFTNEAVRSKERTGCAYKGFREPAPTLNVKARIGQQKQKTKTRPKAPSTK